MHRITRNTAVLGGGLTAATLDIAFALIYYGFRGVPPMRNLQTIASGVLGAASFGGGAPTAALGLGLHYFILIVAAIVFYAASVRMRWLVRHAALAGVLYGVAIFFCMNLVIVPLSALPNQGPYPPSFPLGPTLMLLVVHMVLVGLPIGLWNRRAHSSRH